MHGPSTCQIVTYFLPIYLYIGPTSDTEWVTKVKPDMNSVEIHQQLSHQGLDSTPMRELHGYR
jgi:hypothetical protein